MLLSRILTPRAATPENPRFNLNDPAAWDALGAQPAASGVRVNRSTALQYSPYYRALSLISGAIAKLKVTVSAVAPSGKKPDPTHPAYALLRRRPNREQTPMVWKRQMAVHSLAEGNGYSYINRDGSGKPRELWPLDPVKTFPVRVDGVKWYVTEIGTEKRKLRAEDVLHFPGLSYDGMTGLSITECGREALGLGMGASRYGAIVFKNSGRPSIVLLHPLKLDEKTKLNLREGWERMHTGLDNAHRTAILDQGLTLKEVSMNAQQSQLLELLRLNQIDIANFFDLPAHKLGSRDTINYNSLEQQNQEFLEDCLDPRLVTWEEEFECKLLTDVEKDAESHVIEFERRGLVRASMQVRSAYFRTALGGRGWMTQNEVREEEDLNPMETPEADQILDPLNMAKPGASGGGDGVAPCKALADDPQFLAAVQRMTGRVVAHKSGLAKACKSTDALRHWIAGLYGEHESVFAEVFAPWGEHEGADWLLATIHDHFAAGAKLAEAGVLDLGTLAADAKTLPDLMRLRAAEHYAAPDAA
jgi:HK97 family phage portal protein